MKKTFLLSLFLAIIFGLVFPFGDNVSFLLPIVLSVLLFFNFYEIEFKLENFLKIEILFGLIFGLIILPVIIFFSTQSLILPFRIGLILIAISPTAIGSSVIIRIIGGDVGFSIANTVFYNFLSIISYPVLIKLFFHDETTNIPFQNIMINLLIIIIIPFILAGIIKKIEFSKKIILELSKYVNYLFIIVVYIAISSSALILRKIDWKTLIIVSCITFGISIIYFLTGFLSGKNFQYRKTLSSCMGQKNTGLCILVALSNFNPLTAIPATIYIVVHHIINAILISFFVKSKKNLHTSK